MTGRARALAKLRFIFEGTPSAGFYVPDVVSPPVDKVGDKTRPAFGPEPTFPFHTEAAGRVWKKVREVLAADKTIGPAEVLQRAIDAADVNGVELTPEDLRLLEMAIEWSMKGPPPSDVSGLP